MRLFHIPSYFVLFISSLFGFQAQAQHLFTDQNIHDYGIVEDAETLYSVFLLKNTSESYIYILRADADLNLKIHTSKKKLNPGDTATLSVLYTPKNSGRFNCKIELVLSSSAQKQSFFIKGKVNRLVNNEKTLCYNFSSGKPIIKNNIDFVLFSLKDSVKSDILKIPENFESSPINKNDSSILFSDQKFKIEKSLFTSSHKTNNLVFLLDISASMRDSSKLPYLKFAIIELMNQIREEDKISLLVYNDSIRVLEESVNASNRKKIIDIVSQLKARGSTKGAQAILLAADVAVRNYIESGNNQVILATDGEFPFYNSHYEKWFSKLNGKQIGISVVALGEDKKAQKSLKTLSSKGKGTYLHVSKKQKEENMILKMILEQSSPNQYEN